MEIVRQVARQPGSRITLAYVVEVKQSIPLDAELPAEVVRGEQVLADAGMIATSCVGGKVENVATELLQARSAGAAIVDQAMDEDASAILLACSISKKHGRTTIGDTVDYVLRHAPCEVHVVRLALPGIDSGGADTQ
jgi:nucleotide-binding universal stress UspA family protein